MFSITLSIVVFTRAKIKHASQNVDFDVFDVDLILNFDIVIDEYFDLSYLSKNKFFENYENFQIFVINVNFNRFFNFFKFNILIFQISNNNENFFVINFIIAFRENYFFVIKINKMQFFIVIILKKHFFKISIRKINFQNDFFLLIIIS